MKGIAKGLIAVGLGLVFLATPANAQINWAVGAGLSLPNGDLSNGFKSGFHGMAAGDFALTGAPISIRADGMFSTMKSKVSGADAFNPISVSADLKFGFAPGPVSPYILGGATWNHWSFSGVSTSKVGYNIGGGINFGMSALKLFAEARYFSVSDNGAKVNWIPITVGIHF